MTTRAKETEEYALTGVAKRLAPYAVACSDSTAEHEAFDDELVERAMTLLRVMPLNQSRETIEDLVSPNDPWKGRRAIDALLEAELAVEDDLGRLRQIA
jgi:hypothetical protein